MIFFPIIILALVQGVTEFLPVSSSGHLVLTHFLLDGKTADICWDYNRSLDIAVHIGTLFAVLAYFRKDFCDILCGVCDRKSSGFRTLINIIIASIPVIIAGLILQIFKPSLLCLLEVMAWMTLIFGILLWFADQKPMPYTLPNMTKWHALWIGLAQAIALIPGTSRSGVTMTTARWLGYNRTDSAKFSLLLAVIAISGAGILGGLDLTLTQSWNIGYELLIAAAIACVTAFGAIHIMMHWLAKASFLPFVLYRIGLGGLLLMLIYMDVI